MDGATTTQRPTTKARGLSLRAYLVLLVISVMVPVFGFVAVLFVRYVDSELQGIEQELQSNARQLAQTVDRDLIGLESILQMLTTSRALRSGDFASLDEQITEVKRITGVDVVLRDTQGQQIVGSRQAMNAAPPRILTEADEQALRNRLPAVSGVMITASGPVFGITVPILRDGTSSHLISLSLPASRMTDLLKQGLPSDRIAGIIDQKGLALARTEKAYQFIGKPLSDDVRAMVMPNGGMWRGLNGEGHNVHSAFAPSGLTGWTIWVSSPDAAFIGPLVRASWTLAALGAGLTLLAILAAYFVGGQMSRSASVLTTQAAAVGANQLVEARSLAVREFNEVGQTLAATSFTLREHEQRRDKAEGDLRRLSESLEKKVSERTYELMTEMQRRTETENTLRQIQKMEAVGQLTGGIAHDFNNMLGVVIGNLDLAKRRLDRGDSKIDKFIQHALEAGQRAASLTQRLLAFARQQPLSPEAIDANRLVADMSELLRRSLGEMVQLETVLAGGLWHVNADTNALENALLNLAVNARDAMPQGGKLTIETANASLDDSYKAAHPDVSVGQYVQIAVTDTGTGMAPEVIAKAFDPFFTTKQTAGGTGLGLSQVYGFAKQSGGHIMIYSEMGRGTTVKLYLPRFLGELPELDTVADQSPLPTNDGSTTVLVVEDEAAVRAHATNALRELGYTVLEVAHAYAALSMLDAHPEVALLFTDVVMPDMNGRQLADEARRRRPSLRVLFTTGYTRNAIVHNGVLDPGVQLIGKPFTLDQLARKVADVLRA
jgi:signal transduction histidine kinase